MATSCGYFCQLLPGINPRSLRLLRERRMQRCGALHSRCPMLTPLSALHGGTVDLAGEAQRPRWTRDPSPTHALRRLRGGSLTGRYSTGDMAGELSQSSPDEFHRRRRLAPSGSGIHAETVSVYKRLRAFSRADCLCTLNSSIFEGKLKGVVSASSTAVETA